MKKEMIPHEWSDYVGKSFVGLEVVPWVLYDTEFFKSGKTLRLDFFRTVKKSRAHTNMNFGGMLPDPQAFLIRSIAINGVTTNIQLGFCTLTIGDKLYQVTPAWNFALKGRGLILSPNIVIARLQNFQFQMEWEAPVDVGAGLSGRKVIYHPLQVCLHGVMARSVC